MLLFFVVLALSILIGKYIYEIHQFNHSSELIQLQNPNHLVIKDLLKTKSPVVIHNLIGKYDISDFSLDSLIKNNPGYIIDDNGKNISLSAFKENDKMYVLNNKLIIKHTGFENNFDEIHESFCDKFSCNTTHELSILKGNQYLPLNQNKHNCEYYSQLNGETIFYLFNPKHESDIKNKTTAEIKKWAFKINLKSGLTVYIPPGWYYFYESSGTSIISRSFSDNYFTWLYNNYLR